MKLSTWLGHVIKSGEITVFTHDEKVLQLKSGNKKFELNSVNKEFLKDVLGSMDGRKSVKSKLTQLKEIATELKDEGITVTFSYQGDLVLTVGSEANPKFSRLVTRINAIEINNLRKLIELGV
jgi:hypothetical protein